MIVNSNDVMFDRRCEMIEGESVKDLSWNGGWIAPWIMEIKIPKNTFHMYSEMEWGFTYRRLQARVQNAAFWNLPFIHDPRYFSVLEFQQNRKVG